MLKKWKTNTSGTSMVEVLIALFIVSAILALFTKSVLLASDLYSRSHDIIKKTETFNSNYYKISEKSNNEIYKDDLKLSIDTEKTASQNMATAVTIPLSSNIVLKKYPKDASDGLVMFFYDDK